MYTERLTIDVIGAISESKLEEAVAEAVKEYCDKHDLDFSVVTYVYTAPRIDVDLIFKHYADV